MEGRNFAGEIGSLKAPQFTRSTAVSIALGSRKQDCLNARLEARINCVRQHGRAEPDAHRQRPRESAPMALLLSGAEECLRTPRGEDGETDDSKSRCAQIKN